MSKYIYGLLIVFGSSIVCYSSVWAAQIHTDVLPNSTISLSYVSGGQLASMSLTNNSSLRQFVPYSDTNGIAYTCDPLSWLSHLTNPIGQPVMWGTANRGLTVSCATQCGPLMRGTAYGDEANNQYCADGSPRTFVSVVGSDDKLHWTCGTSPTQCRAYKGCIIEGHGAFGNLEALASTYPGGNDVYAARIAHNKAVQLGNGSSGPYGDEGMLRCMGGQLYAHTAGTSLACGTPLGSLFTFGPYGQNISFYGYHPGAASISSATIYWLDDAGNGVSVFSIQSGASYCSDYAGCFPMATWIYDPNDNADWNYGPGLDPNGSSTAGTCAYSGSVSTS